MRRQNRLFTQSAIALCIASGSMIIAGCATAARVDVDKAAAAERQPYGKPTSGVLVQHSVPDSIGIGETVTLRLQVGGITAADGATVEVRDPSTGQTLATMRLAQGERRIIEVPYTGRSDGMQFLDVATTQAGRSSVQSVPLRVGSGELSLKPQGSKQTTATGENVISMPLAEPAARR